MPADHTTRTVSRFRLGMRVRVREPVIEGHHPLSDYVTTAVVKESKFLGTVVRMRRGDEGAWIALDERGPDAIHPFPADDHRACHVLAYPEDCEAVK